MRILFDLGHPKDVNVFKNVISVLKNKGHEIKLFVRAKENTKKILKEYGLDYELCRYYESFAGKAFGIFINDFYLYKIARRFKPDVFVSPGSPYAAHVSKLLGKPHIAFSDTEVATLVARIALPFTDKIYTSTSFYLDFGKKQERFKGYYELAYLHPKYFTPNIDVLKKYGLYEDYIILRLSALSSHHDINAKGFKFSNEEELLDYLKNLEEYGRVIIFSDKTQWQTIKNHQLELNPKDLHDLIYYSKLCIGEGATMASEAAILGVPSIYVSNTQRGYLNELEKKYGLVFNLSDKREALTKALTILKDTSIKNQWKLKREKMLNETIDVVEFIINAIEESVSNVV